MMVAMMVPAVSPVILLFTEINRRRNEQPGTLAPTGQFLLGCLTVWTGFSVLVTLAQWGLLTVALISPMMESTSKVLGAGLLLVAGLFQFSRLKFACLTHCRSPMGFLATEWRGGSWGAFRMGLKHGGYCLGCCWALMGLLFAFGVMNLFWVASISFSYWQRKSLRSGTWSVALPASSLLYGQHGLFLGRYRDNLRLTWQRGSRPPLP